MSEPTTAGGVMRECLRHWDFRKNQIIPNSYLAGWEADLLVIRPSGWVEEVEIKISKSDFRAEWKHKAEKHEDLRLGRCRYLGWNAVEHGSHPEDDPRLVERRGFLYIRDRPSLVRKFWFAMPATLAAALLDEVPADYGVLAVGHLAAEVLREPTVLKCARKITDADRLKALDSMYFRYWQATLRGEVDLSELITARPYAEAGDDLLPVVPAAKREEARPEQMALAIGGE